MTNQHSYEDSRAPEVSAFGKRLRTFRDRLPDDQRRAFHHVLAGAGATLQAAERLGGESEKGSITSAITALRKDLPNEQREQLDAILLASAFAWRVQAGRSAVGGTSRPSGGAEPVAMAHIEAIIRLSVGVGVVAAGIISELLEDDVEVLVPDITLVL